MVVWYVKVVSVMVHVVVVVCDGSGPGKCVPKCSLCWQVGVGVGGCFLSTRPLSALSNWSPESLSQPLLSTGETPGKTDQK